MLLCSAPSYVDKAGLKLIEVCLHLPLWENIEDINQSIWLISILEISNITLHEDATFHLSINMTKDIMLTNKFCCIKVSLQTSLCEILWGKEIVSFRKTSGVHRSRLWYNCLLSLKELDYISFHMQLQELFPNSTSSVALGDVIVLGLGHVDRWTVKLLLSEIRPSSQGLPA